MTGLKVLARDMRLEMAAAERGEREEREGRERGERGGKEERIVPPVGSLAAGKMSLPQIDQAAAAVTIPAKPGSGVRSCQSFISLASTVGVRLST